MRTSRNGWSAAPLLVLGILLPSCSGGDSPTESSQPDSVVIESISPAQGTVLLAGSPVTFHARVRYVLSSRGTGRISMVIQDQASRNISPTVPQPSASITLGTGVVELSDSVTLPASGVTSVNLFLPLFPSGVTSSTALQRVTYSVR